MSFLPYAPTRTSVLLASFGGSTAIHGAVVLGVLTSSVALLPEPSNPAIREPEYEITLEILDADVIDLDTIEDAPLIPPDAVPLEPETGAAEVLEPDADALDPLDDAAALEPETDALSPVEDTLAPPAPQDLVAPETEALEAEPDSLAALEPDATAALPADDPLVPDVVQEPITAPAPQPLPPVRAVDPDDLAIDDLTLFEEEVFSPLAEGVAPAPEPSEDEALIPDAILPDVSSEPEDIAILLPEPENLGPEPQIIAPEPEAPVAPVVQPLDETDAVQPQPEAQPEPETVVEPEPEPAAVPDAAPEPEAAPETETATAPTDDTATEGAGNAQVIANPSPAVRQIGELIRRIRATPGPQCALALPRRSGEDGTGVSMIGATLDTLDALAARIVPGLDPEPAQTRELVDARQCAALDIVRQSATYPASRIGLAVQDTTLESGESLQARVLGAGGLYLTLLLIDDNGVVQDLARFTTLDGNDPVIDVPVARSGPARDTRQLLLVLGSPEAPIDLSAGIGRTAQDAFSGVPPELFRDALFGIVSIDIR